MSQYKKSRDVTNRSPAVCYCCGASLIGNGLFCGKCREEIDQRKDKEWISEIVYDMRTRKR